MMRKLWFALLAVTWGTVALFGLGVNDSRAEDSSHRQSDPSPTHLSQPLLNYPGIEVGVEEAPVPVPACQGCEAMPTSCGAGCEMRTSGCDECDEQAKGLRGTTQVRVFPRPGNFFIAPRGKGYYSLSDALTGTERDAPPKFPYSRIAPMPKSFFDADFRYLATPGNAQNDCFEPWHQIYLNQDWLLSVGGEVRWRYMNEVNSRLSGRNNDYDLLRSRIYGDLWYKDYFRIYVEGIDAHSFGNELPRLRTDVNRTDILNAFVDVKIGQTDEAPVYARVGRQELLFGSQRLISPLDWANTRRTFEGVRFFHQGKNFDVDLFWAQPVISNASNFDDVDLDQHFGGIWFTHRPKKGTFTDLYYLVLDDDSPAPLLGQRRSFAESVHTVGMRHTGDHNQWLWDIEGMVQFGDRGEQSLLAGAASAGGGYHFKNAPLHPTIWVYYDYASGDDNPDAGDRFSTFNQLFPFGHYYLGWIDLVGRQNIHDLNAHCFLFPTRWTTIWLQYHHFELDSARDALYNAGGVAIRRDPTGAAGTDVGDEMDIIVSIHLDAHSDVFLGYSKLWSGSFIRNTGPRRDAEFFFAQYGFRW